VQKEPKLSKEAKLLLFAHHRAWGLAPETTPLAQYSINGSCWICGLKCRRKIASDQVEQWMTCRVNTFDDEINTSLLCAFNKLLRPH